MFFLYVLALAYIIFAIIQDVRKREVANWLNFSLVVFALTYRLFYSIFSLNFWFFIYGLFGFACFFILAHIFYYSKLFAGGDAKLLMGIGTILPYSSFLSSFRVLIYFIFLLLIAGSLYSLVYSIILVLRNRKKFFKQFSLQFEKNKALFFYFLVFAVIFSVLIFLTWSFIEASSFYLFVIPLLILLFPLLFFYSKAIEESCMVFNMPVSRLTEGDWLYQDIKIGGKKIRARWSGLSASEIKLIRKYKKRGRVKIKQGIPFTPSFLLALLFLLWNPSWYFI